MIAAKVKPTDPSDSTAGLAPPFKSVCKGAGVIVGAAIALDIFCLLIGFHFFGPKSGERWGAASRLVGEKRHWTLVHLRAHDK